MTRPTAYLSDSYLNETCRLLWICWKTAGGATFKGKEKEMAPLASPRLSRNSQADNSGLGVVDIEDLRKLIEVRFNPFH